MSSVRRLVLSLALVGCAKQAAPTAADDHHQMTAHEQAQQPEGAHPGHDGAHAHDDATSSHRFDDPERWAKVFDNPERDAWQRPVALVDALRIPEGATVADIGAGTGYFNRHLAAAVGPEGHVLAVDIEPSLIQHMTERAQAEGTPQVTARVGQPDDPGLEAGTYDLVMMVDTYHHVSDRVAYFQRILPALTAEGRLVIVDFKQGELPVGPPPSHKLPVEQVHAELTKAGWVHAESLDVLPHQYVEVFTPPPATPAAE